MEYAAPSVDTTNIIDRIAKGSAVSTIFVLPISTTLAVILFLLTTLLTLASGHWREKLALIQSNRVAIFLLGFYLLFLIGTVYSIAHFHDIEKQLIKFSWMLLVPLWIPLFTQKKWRDRAINAFLIVMAITLFLSYLKYHHWTPISDSFWLHLGPRFNTHNAAIFKDHLVQGFLLGIATNVFLYRFIQSKKWFYGVLALLGTFNILLMSKGRTGYIIMIILLSYTFFTQIGIKKGIIYTLLLIASFSIALTILPGPVHVRAKLVIQNVHQFHQGDKTTSLGYRYAWMKNALLLIKERPIIGYGTGSIKAAYATLPKKETTQTGIVENTSNEYLNVMLQFGAIGLLIFVGMLYTQWRYSFLLPKDLKFIFQISLIALCVGNLANSWLMDFTQAHFYAILIALTFAALPMRSKSAQAASHAYNDDV